MLDEVIKYDKVTDKELRKACMVFKGKDCTGRNIKPFQAAVNKAKYGICKENPEKLGQKGVYDELCMVFSYGKP